MWNILRNRYPRIMPLYNTRNESEEYFPSCYFGNRSEIYTLESRKRKASASTNVIHTHTHTHKYTHIRTHKQTHTHTQRWEPVWDLLSSFKQGKLRYLLFLPASLLIIQIRSFLCLLPHIREFLTLKAGGARYGSPRYMDEQAQRS